MLDDLFARHRFDAVIHFAGLKAVGESVSKPLKYYETNLLGSLVQFRAMARHGVKQLVFNSSATVYGDPESLSIRENAPRRATNPYGRTKLMIEEILEDIAQSDPDWRIATLRYFNPIGAQRSSTRLLPAVPAISASCYANADKACSELGWKAKRGLAEMCADA